MEHAAIEQPQSPLAIRSHSLSRLFGLLSISFSYPSAETAEKLTSEWYLDAMQACLEESLIQGALSLGEIMRFREAAQCPARERVHDLRVEMTRLFFASPRLIPLEGSHWVAAEHRDDVAREQGERFSVGCVYKALGLKNRNNVNEPFDHLVSELDLMSYVTHAEAQAWEAGDADDAREWRLIGEEFTRHHLGDLAFGVASEAKRLSRNGYVHIATSTLNAAVSDILDQAPQRNDSPHK